MIDFIVSIISTIVIFILAPILVGSFFLGLMGDLGRNGNRPE
jgi:hypothetical protein